MGEGRGAEENGWAALIAWGFESGGRSENSPATGTRLDGILGVLLQVLHVGVALVVSHAFTLLG